MIELPPDHQHPQLPRHPDAVPAPRHPGARERLPEEPGVLPGHGARLLLCNHPPLGRGSGNRGDEASSEGRLTVAKNK